MDRMSRYRDLDHVVTKDGRIHRVVGNLDSATELLAYNVYSPTPDGDRTYRGRCYRKHFTEDERAPG
jgi:predicted nucleotidyltransferase